ncbi:MAG: ATP-binding cassette domain-containing protein [Pyrinomonadaceae bacterium]
METEQISEGSNFGLVVNSVSKSFGDFKAVDELSFGIRKGSIFGFLGPNGAGKTTTIRMIVGITRPDSGDIELLGQKIGPEIQDRIGYLPEERGLYKKMKVRDQLRYFAALKGIGQNEADKRIDYWLDRVNLLEWRDKKTTDLSKGMSQKIQFVGSILHDPDLLILDEPFSGLDPVNVEFMKGVIAEVKSRDKTIIFSTHLMETAERLCDEILLINKSKKVLSGSLREIKESYGRNMVVLRAVGCEDCLGDPSLVARVVEHSDEKEVFLTEGADPQALLNRLIESGAIVSKFELAEPSLNDIFIDKIRSN